ncbi:hypothetical protein LB519_14720 [Mesorhizobium sp. AD1-1]|uniref:hypothetical protein n=1 Tax=Mesorhizobium sp. AD1-1 TaxID=2876621 RepID=UPI001CCFD268|nr:hypothetical protein [Mesorhizobium sp. AD1-1]MBZ9719099.1 hypothetical protein [Mesorhizobium sp. AD1-1]
MRKPKKVAQPTGAGPESILPLTDFRADPWKTGDDNAVAFRAGIMSSPVPAEFAHKARDEGKAAPVSDHPKPPMAKKPAPEKQADQSSQD